MNEDGDLILYKHVKFSLSVENYKDDVLSDVVPMEVCHILLGRPWKFDKKTTHDDVTNEITFTHMEKKFILYPLTPSQVVKDQLQMKLKREKEKIKVKNKVKVLRDNDEAWDKSAHSHKVIQIEQKLEKNEVKKILLSEQPSGLLLCKGALTCSATLFEVSKLPPKVKNLIKEFGDVFPEERPIGLQIDLVSRASLTNRLAYKPNLEKTKEIESQVQELLKKGWIQKSLSSCVVLVLLVPKKDGKWRMCCDC